MLFQEILTQLLEPKMGRHVGLTKGCQRFCIVPYIESAQF